MDRSALALVALLAALGCGTEASSPPSSTEPSPSADPRLPRAFDVPLPDGVTVRWGATADGRARAIATTEADPEATRGAAEAALRARGWTTRRDGDAVLATADGRERARVEVAAGPSGLTRIEASEPRTGRGEAEPEPRAWRRIERPPLPAPPSEGASAPCAEAMRRACERWAAEGGGDALDCGLDHRAACARVEAFAYLQRSLEDADARLAAALTAYDQVGSPAARAETAAQVALERLAARAVVTRARAAGLAAPGGITDRIAATSDIGGEDPPTEDWFTARNSDPAAPVGDAVPPEQEPD